MDEQILNDVQENILDDYFNACDIEVGIWPIGKIDSVIVNELNNLEDIQVLGHKEDKVKIKTEGETFTIYFDPDNDKWVLKEKPQAAPQEHIEYEAVRETFKEGKSPMQVGKENKTLDLKRKHDDGLLISDREYVEEKAKNKNVTLEYMDNKYWLFENGVYTHISKTAKKYYDHIQKAIS